MIDSYHGVGYYTFSSPVPCHQFLTDVFSAGGAVLVWVDMMKMGRVQNKALDELISRVKKILSRKSSHSVAYVLAPFLVSTKTLNSQLRGETRHSGVF